MVADCWMGLTDSPPAVAVGPTTNSITSRASNATNPSRILRKLRTTTRTESIEEAASCASGEQPALSSTGSVRSRTSNNRSPDTTQSKENNGDFQRVRKDAENRRSQARIKRKVFREIPRDRHASTTSDKQPSTGMEASRSFHVLLQMSSNYECLGYLLRGLLQHIHSILRLLQQRNDITLHRSMAALLHNILKTALEAYGSRAATDSDCRRELVAVCCTLLKVCLSLIHGVHDHQFTALVTINKVIDVCVVHKLGHSKYRAIDALRHPCNDKSQPTNELGEQQSLQTQVSVEGGQEAASGGGGGSGATPSRPRNQKLSAKRLGSVWRHAAGEQIEQVRKTITPDSSVEESIMDVLSSAHAVSILNILHNSLTLYKRVIGSKQLCSPSQRFRQCSYHCLQLMATRVLLFMVETPSVQTQLVQEPQLRILTAALDSTNDPQLLVLALQIVATVALDPANHRALLDHGMPDVLSQLLLPSDEWYYTNHTTKYARYVKHHVARILVYLGFQHRVNLRFSVYDLLLDDAPPPTPLTESVEDSYITMTSAPQPIISCKDSKAILGITVENAIICILKSIEGTLTQGVSTSENSTLQWVLSGYAYSHISRENQLQTTTATADRRLTDAASTGFVQSFLSCFPAVLSPVVVLRLLLHRLLTTAAHLQRWKSCASRSSFASATAGHDAPRSPRSRASSTDTEPGSTLRKRRKVNLTVDCSGWGGSEAGSVDETATAATVATAATRQPRGSMRPAARDSISSASGLGLEPAMQAIFAFSHILRPAQSRDSLHSVASSDGRHSPGNSPPGLLPLHAFNLLHHKPRGSFRFSSLRHSNKQRSKSHANITKVLQHNGGAKETPEQEILAFQKQLQNLPDFDSPEHPSGHSSDPAAAAAEFLANRVHLRPRSRSMPRVTYESSRFLTLPEAPCGGGGSLRLPRGRSAGTLGFPAADLLPCGPVAAAASPVGTPVEERRVSSGALPPCAPNSRRSSLSPSDRTTRRRDSPACLQMEIPPWHRCILNFIEEWLRVSRVELDRNAALCREIRDFLGKVAPCGAPYQQWAAEMRQEFPALNKDPDLEGGDDLESTDREYCQSEKWEEKEEVKGKSEENKDNDEEGGGESGECRGGGAGGSRGGGGGAGAGGEEGIEEEEEGGGGGGEGEGGKRVVVVVGGGGGGGVGGGGEEEGGGVGGGGK
ncbi:hypothetical protein LSTR_LSTR009970 [Laodelphax striatellus]|uniref:Uncharacterized protein n=1 Tax=Laodelphax striatellus TaxID=195883 RepID=A0A482XI61_LAOST|nr:hypothetical protein LSTR_LSTR009970 [Laodelphax striatellus]